MVREHAAMIYFFATELQNYFDSSSDIWIGGFIRESYEFSYVCPSVRRSANWFVLKFLIVYKMK